MTLLKQLLLATTFFTFYALHSAAESDTESSSSDEEKGFGDRMRSAIEFVSAFDPEPGNVPLCTKLYDLIMRGSIFDIERATEIGKLRTLNSTESFLLKKQIGIRAAALEAVRDHQGPFWHYTHKVRRYVEKMWAHPDSRMKEDHAIGSYLQKTENWLQSEMLEEHLSEKRKSDLQMRLQEIALLKKYRPDCTHAALFWLHVDAIHYAISSLEISLHSQFKWLRLTEPEREIPREMPVRDLAKKAYIEEESERLRKMYKRFKNVL